MNYRSLCPPAAVTALALLLVPAARLAGDEGMWLFNQPPRELLESRYHFSPDAKWLEHLQHAAVRFNSGGSGSFVSSQGLVMTNHHVGADALQKLSTAKRDLLREGFHAKSRSEELKCVDLELNVLQSIEDVTARVNAAVSTGKSPAVAAEARRAAMAQIEKESLDRTGLRSDVVTLYHGGQYHLYRYKKFTDVRLVFAPEQSIAFFGGDADNFEYPRYDLDICFFRVYENDRPAKIEHHLTWSRAGAGDGELVFVAGHPGRTERLDTVAHLEFLRDHLLPYNLNKIRRREVMLLSYSQRSLEHARQARDELFMYQNSRKARLGALGGLQDPSLLGRKREEENKFRSAVAASTELRPIAQGAWEEIETSLRTLEPAFVSYDLLEQAGAFNSRLFSIARALLRLGEETPKPNGQRMREYRESNLESLRQALFSEAPIYPELERLKLTDSLSMYLELAGARDPLARQVLADRSPSQRATELVRGTRMGDVAFRRQLAEGKAAPASSDDPMLLLAKLVDPKSRDVRKTVEEQVEELQRQAYGKIARARFALYGTSVYPDATFTLRLSIGQVKGYREEGKNVPPWTTLGAIFPYAEEHGDREPFVLPQSWRAARQQIPAATPFNFVSTNDIIGGNSGSPVVNRRGELVGIIFDGNPDSLVWNFVFSQETGRSIAVHSAGIRDALRTVYRATELVEELGR